MQLTDLTTYDSHEDVIFSNPKINNVKNSKLTYKRIKLSQNMMLKKSISLMHFSSCNRDG